MQPQGSSVVNPAYFTSLQQRYGAVNSCAELQALVNETFASIAAEEAAVTAQIAALAPMLSLLSLSISDLPSVIKFLNTLVSAFLTPMLKPSITYGIQLGEIAAQIAELTATINSISGQFPSCSISVPGV